MKPILIIEDEHAVASALGAVCQRLSHEPRLCSSGRRGLDELARGEFALAILDIGLPDLSGLEVLKEIHQRAPELPALIITAHGNLDNAVAAKKLGAAGYLVKPLDLREVQETIRQLASTAPAPAAAAQISPSLLIGAAPAMQRCFVEIAHACTSEAPVLISGPTGTGKTLAARVIHLNSPRSDAPFVTLHCSALPEHLLESELFGHEKGAFTGAVTSREGHLERACGGTLFLDEIADISLSTQAKLLRFVEEHTFTRLGGREDLRVDLRLVTATNRDLREEVRAGRFREDLYYRLHVLEIALPALCERPGDIPALANYFWVPSADRTRVNSRRLRSISSSAIPGPEMFANFATPSNTPSPFPTAASSCPSTCHGNCARPMAPRPLPPTRWILRLACGSSANSPPELPIATCTTRSNRWRSSISSSISTASQPSLRAKPA